MHHWLLNVVVIAVILFGAETSYGENKNRAAHESLLDGRWELVKIVFAVVEANPVPLDDDLKRATVTIKGDHCIITAANESLKFRLKVDPNSTPKEVDLIQNGRVVQKCIYAVSRDSLKLCFHVAVTRIPTITHTPDAPRPTGFDQPHADRPGVILVFRRVADR